MELDKPNPANNLMLFKKELWIRDYSTRMQRWLNGERLAPVRIDAELHRRCNLSCVHCVRRASKTDISMESERIEVPERRWLDIAEESGRMGVRMWNIAGIGEPMCKPSLLMGMMKTIKRHRMFGELTTNGTLWNESDIEEVVKIGWDSINVSIDAPIEEIHDAIRRVPGTFRKARKTVELLNKYRKKHQRDVPCITINLVLNRLNYRLLPEMVEFVAGIGGDALFVEPMIVHTDMAREIKLGSKEAGELKRIIEAAEKRAYELNVMAFITCLAGDDEKKEFNKDLVENTSEIKEVILKAAEKQAETQHKATGNTNQKNMQAMNVAASNIDSILSIPCYYPWFYMIINADGSAIHCGECSDLRENIKDNSLEDIWHGKHFTALRNQFLTSTLPDYCNKCRPNVIGDMSIVRKSIKEYADTDHLQRKLIQLFKDNMMLKEELYYAKKNLPMPEKRSHIFKRIKMFRF